MVDEKKINEDEAKSFLSFAEKFIAKIEELLAIPKQ